MHCYNQGWLDFDNLFPYPSLQPTICLYSALPCPHDCGPRLVGVGGGVKSEAGFGIASVRSGVKLDAGFGIGTLSEDRYLRRIEKVLITVMSESHSVVCFGSRFSGLPNHTARYELRCRQSFMCLVDMAPPCNYTKRLLGLVSSYKSTDLEQGHLHVDVLSRRDCKNPYFHIRSCSYLRLSSLRPTTIYQPIPFTPTFHMSPVKDFDVAIVGGGIAGLTLAIALNSRSIPVTLYEQARSFGEIGAGVSFSPNAVQAMKVCHQGIYEAFETVCTRNMWPSKEKVWFDYVDAYSDVMSNGVLDTAFTISSNLGQNGVHRAHFLDEAVKLIPNQLARFGKRLQNISEDRNGRLVMHFDDGTVAEADAIIGCDGIKSRVRQTIVGPDHPSARPVYTHKYAFRGLIPMEDACAAVGEERAQNACMYVSALLPFAITD